MARTEIKTHLLVQTAFVGDLLLSIPLLKELRDRDPDAKLVLLCRKGLGDFFIRAALVDEIVEVDKGDEKNSSWRSAREKLAGRRFDLILCPHESFRSAAFVMRLRANRKIGFRRWFNFAIFTDRVERPMHLPEALRQLSLLAPLDEKWGKRLAEYGKNTRAGGLSSEGLARVPEWAEMSVPRLMNLKSNRDPKLLSSDRVRAVAERLDLANSGRQTAILAPGSVWATKMWPLDGYTRVARELLSKGWRVVALGAANEKEICGELVRRAPGVQSIAGDTNLFESTEIIALADLVVCNDSGAMHMASAAATPAVSIFGPTILQFGYRPWQNKSHVLEVSLDCRPCGKHGARECPLGTHACMKQVSAESVLVGIESVTH